MNPSTTNLRTTVATVLADLIFEARYQVDKRRTLMWHRIGRMVPDRVAYWVLIAQGAKHCGGPDRPHEVVPSVLFTTVLQRVGDSLEEKHR